jgi:hypothetical protein
MVSKKGLEQKTSPSKTPPKESQAICQKNGRSLSEAEHTRIEWFTPASVSIYAFRFDD